MNRDTGTVSVVIPCYNSASFIAETLVSVLAQEQVSLLEIIVVDDGSLDDTAGVVRSFNDRRIRYCYQQNAGVSAARNKGLSLASGTYVVFFDSDDIMSGGFLAARVEAVERNPDYGFSCGYIHTFPEKGKILCGAVKNISKEILHYLPDYATCPSNYLIRRDTLEEYGICFNERLSSTADRFFLLELDKVTRGILVTGSPLLYRVSASSMSNKLSEKLVLDNELFLQMVEKSALLPPELKYLFRHKIYYILGLAFLNVKHPAKGLKYLCRSALLNPLQFLRAIGRTLLH